jgi:hypothetical protein
VTAPDSEVRALLEENLSYSVISSKTGVSLSRVGKIAKASGLNGRHMVGHLGRQRLSDDAVIAIRQWTPACGPQQDWGARWGISPQMVSLITRRLRHGDVPDPPTPEELSTLEAERREQARQRFCTEFTRAMKDAGRPLDPVTIAIISSSDVELPDELFVVGTAGWAMITTTPEPDRDKCWHVSHVVFVMRRGTTAADIRHAITEWLSPAPRAS